ncbi:MAG: YggS family pyridoxal phosphate-dependent enzyme [Muribaculaceae bacterium]|nr:YggS family pyridoxal phosphate-dependent enzyme [Muribaculaceae bacterium]
MTTVAQRLNEVKSTLPATGVQLVAVSKFHPAETIREAYDAGHRCFGESRAQELQQKYDQLPHDIEWHFIGHLQTNKVKYIIPYVAMIHSVDSPRILDEIERQAARVDRVVDCLLEVHVAQEETKFGFSPDECVKFLASLVADTYPHIRFRGIMGMASNTDDEAQVRAEFAQLKQLFDTVRGGVMAGNNQFDTLSMGMSLDYRMAIEQGSTMVRIGTTIFGEREY